MDARLLPLNNGTVARLIHEPNESKPTLILDFGTAPKGKAGPLYQLSIVQLAPGKVRSTLHGPQRDAKAHKFHPTAKDAIVQRLLELGLWVETE